LNHGEAENKNKRNFHIVQLSRCKYKLKIKKFGMWFFVRQGLKPKIFEDFSDVVRDIQQRKKNV
jgi:hypothetical protein